MSHFPYGTQIEKGMIPVMETLGNKADIGIKFVNYAKQVLVEHLPGEDVPLDFFFFIIFI